MLVRVMMKQVEHNALPTRDCGVLASRTDMRRSSMHIKMKETFEEKHTLCPVVCFARVFKFCLCKVLCLRNVVLPHSTTGCVLVEYL